MGKLLTLESLNKIAKQRGGKCLSSFYSNSKTPMNWQCKTGHRWSAPASRIIHLKTWCPKCAVDKRVSKMRMGLDYLQKLAADRGGKCNAKSYKNSTEKIEWECQVGHKWKTVVASVVGSKNKIGSWCPYCNSRSRHEELCRILFGYILKAEFPKSRPQWLRGLHGVPLELDGYNEKLKVAFEYHGPHHYKNIPYYKGTENKLSVRLQSQKKRDRLKRKLCKENGVTLIEIQYTKSSSIAKLGEFILSVCEKKKLNPRSKIDFSKIDIKSLWTSKALEKLNLAKSIAVNNGGTLLSEVFISSNMPMKWKCKRGHIWSAVLNRVEDGGWCRRCWDIDRMASLDEVKKVAHLRRGFCLSSEYSVSKEKLIWKCENGHTWKAVFQKIKSGGWCPVCARKKAGDTQRASTEEMQKLAISRGGKCLSDKYKNSITLLKWKCEKKHVWEATAHKIKQGSWCPVCLGKNKTIEDIIEYAKTRNGKCLSKSYVNNRTKLRWECDLGHQWNAAFTNISRGKWCPVCANKQRGSSQRLDIEEMKQVANSRGGKCLSPVYKNANSRLKWKCKEGHIWMATPGHVKHGTWCPRCAKFKV